MDEYINLHGFFVPTNSCGREEVANMRRSQNRNNKVCAKAPNYMSQSASKVPSELSLTASKLEAKYQKHIKGYQPYTYVV